MARYLVGKILLAQGAAGEAVEHLEAAVRLAPKDANIHYQLAQAYQKLGRLDEAQKEFEMLHDRVTRNQINRLRPERQPREIGDSQ